ncbi:hypothetical protein B0H13DRAFT_2257624 [Mycena leptocephala]|nr:hypothetical protein B0H13DRAFT_2257624 [Mycena leptocephala]
MAPVTNGRILFNAIPEDYPIPGKTTVYDTTETIDLENAPLNGGSPHQSACSFHRPVHARPSACPEIKSYMPAFALGQPLMGGGIGVVLRSEIAGVEAGSHVRGLLLHQEYMIAPNLGMLEVIERDPKLNWSVYIGAAGMPGETAFMGWRAYSEAKKVWRVAFVSTGAGPVGSMVIQIAKQEGLKVIASAGSDEKVQFMKEIGADVALTTRRRTCARCWRRRGPSTCVYWDNVGGSTLDAAMEFANNHSRFIECGQISGYNNGYQPMKNPSLIVFKSMHFHGFMVSTLLSRGGLPKLVSGEFKFSEDITRGLDKVGDVLLAVQKGTNTGKAVVVVADH